MSDETIFREVDEELRRERLRTGWRRFGPYVIAAAVGVVAIVGINEGWTWWQSSNAARSSDLFYVATDQEDAGDLAGAQKSFDTVIAQGTGDYPLLAKFKQAGLLVKLGKKDDALKAFDDLAASQISQRLKELALLQAANILVDKGDVPGVKSRITGLLQPDNPLRNSARETLGLAQAKSGDLNGARDSFEAAMADPMIASDTRSRLQLYIAQLVAEGATPPASTTTIPAGSSADAAANAIDAAVNAVAASGDAKPGASPAAAAPAATPAPAANDAPVGVEPNQPATPDAALDVQLPGLPASTAPAAATPAISTGAGLPTLPTTDSTAAPAPANDNAATPAATTAPAAAAPATTAPAASTAPAATPAASTAPAATPAATTPAANDTTKPADGSAAQPAPASSTGQ